jgi:hypothetical protein
VILITDVQNNRTKSKNLVHDEVFENYGYDMRIVTFTSDD